VNVFASENNAPIPCARVERKKEEISCGDLFVELKKDLAGLWQK
jgi:hypothetical protein